MVAGIHGEIEKSLLAVKCLQEEQSQSETHRAIPKRMERDKSVQMVEKKNAENRPITGPGSHSLQHTAKHYNTLQHIATLCNTLQRVLLGV